MKNKLKISTIIAATAGSLLFSSTTYSANLEASSPNPSVLFNDTDSFGDDWFIGGYEDQFLLYDFQTVDNVLQIMRSDNNLNSLIVDSSGDINLANGSVFIDKSQNRIGLGIMTPEDSLHVKGGSGNFILEGGAGVPYSKWRFGTQSLGGLVLTDLLSNTTPFVIDSNTPDSSIFIGPTGVGIGTAFLAPTAKLDVAGDIKATFNGPNTTSGLVELLKMSVNNTTMSQPSDAGFSMENARAGFSWAFRTQENTGGFAASKQGTGAKEFEVRNTTNVAANVELHLANGAKNVGGAWLDASSRSYKKNIHDLSGDDAMQALRGLKSVKYQYKSDQNNTQMVGFIAEDVPELLATHSRKALSSMKIVAVLTKALQVQDKSLQETKADMKAKDAKIAGMEAKIAKLILMQESLAKTLQARFTPFAAESLKANQQVTALDRE